MSHQRLEPFSAQGSAAARICAVGEPGGFLLWSSPAAVGGPRVEGEKDDPPALESCSSPELQGQTYVSGQSALTSPRSFGPTHPTAEGGPNARVRVALRDDDTDSPQVLIAEEAK
jgi:hypothetical protein